MKESMKYMLIFWTDTIEINENGAVQSKTVIKQLEVEKCNISKFKNK